MRNVLVIGMTVAALAIGIPAMAATEDSTKFFALSNLAGKESVPLPEMSDDNLASIEGGQICIGCVNFAIAIQPNINVQTLFAFGNNITQSASSRQGSRARFGQFIGR